MKYLGHLVIEQGVSTDHDKVAAVKDWNWNLAELRSFLGLPAIIVALSMDLQSWLNLFMAW